MIKQKQLQQMILQKKEILEQARIQLKKEFIGIDTVIDQILDSVSSWYLFPDMQTKPVIINLWGLTGVGKTALVNRITALINFSNKFYRFDLGNNSDNGWAVKNKLEDIYESENGFPIVLALDEFQLARTLNARGEEMDKSFSRIIWDLLDSGRFQISRYMSRLGDLYDLIFSLEKVLKRGVLVKGGKVVSRQEYFIGKLKLRDYYMEHRHGKAFLNLKSVDFVPENFHSDIFGYLKDEFRTEDEVTSHIKKLSGEKIVEFLRKAHDAALSPKVVDCSKALIFVMGNIDEAYTMSRDYNPDMSADEFHKQSLKINISDVKKALMLRFRNEQIARLGNTHIIYPAFSSETFRAIIRMELERIKEKVMISQKLKIIFDESICEMIYKEGVYPTQGTRPVYTTIYQVVNTKLGKIVTEMLLNDVKPDEIFVRAEGNAVIVDYKKSKKVIHSFSEKQELNLEKLRKNRKDDMQAICAVHESGHAIISMIVLKTLPEMIYSVTAGSDSNGFVYTSFQWNYTSKEEIVKRIAMFLGGYAAEKIIFGEDKITAGAGNDISMATRLATQMLKNYGMGDFPAMFDVQDFRTNNSIHDTDNKLNKEALKLMEQGLKLAEETLQQQMTLLLKMSSFLADNRFLGKEGAKQLLEQHVVKFSVAEIIENGDLLFYRNHLMQKLNEISEERKPEFQLSGKSIEYSLNKGKDDYSEKR